MPWLPLLLRAFVFPRCNDSGCATVTAAPVAISIGSDVVQTVKPAVSEENEEDNVMSLVIPCK